MANFFDLLRQTLGGNQGLMQNVPSGNPLDPGLGGGNGGGIVATPEQIAQSQAIAARLGIPVDAPVVDDYPQGIPVVANAQAGPAEPAMVDASKYLLDSPVSLNNTAWAQEAQAAREANDKGVVHKGMFGVKGTLRDVLGTIGDAFLVQGGADRVYAPTRHRERVGDAMAGMSQAPRAAVERMTAIDPAIAQQMNKDVNAAEIARANQQSQEAARQAQIRTKGIDMLSRAAGGTNNETYGQMKPIMQKLIDKYGLGDEYRLPDTYDENFMRTLQYSGMPAQGQVSTGLTRDRNAVLEEQGDRRLDQTDSRNAVLADQGAQRIAIAAKQAETARQRMLRSGGSSSGRPRSDTEIEYFQSLQKVPENQRTPDENAWVKKYSGQTGGRGGGGRPSGNNRRPVSTNKFQGWSSKPR